MIILYILFIFRFMINYLRHRTNEDSSFTYYILLYVIVNTDVYILYKDFKYIHTYKHLLLLLLFLGWLWFLLLLPLLLYLGRLWFLLLLPLLLYLARLWFLLLLPLLLYLGRLWFLLLFVTVIVVSRATFGVCYSSYAHCFGFLDEYQVTRESA